MTRALIACQQHRIERAILSTVVDGTEAHLRALMEGWLTMTWIAVAAGLALIEAVVLACAMVDAALR